MSQVSIGTLEDSKKLKSELGLHDLTDWNYRAMWQWLRFQKGRGIDDIIKATISEPYMNDRPKRLAEMRKFFARTVDETPHQRDMQYILTQAGKVVAVASLQHLLIPPQEVYAEAQDILGASGIHLTEEDRIWGKIAYLTEEAVSGLMMGLQIHAGSITTRLAIRVSSFLRVELCTNPISWLGTGSFGWAGLGGKYDKVLRIQVKEELRPRLATAISSAQHGLHSITAKVGHTKKVPLSEESARIITAAMSISYGLGANTIQQVFDRLPEEPATQYGLAMAFSWAARHGDFTHPFTGKMSKETTQKLSTIAGASLMIDDIQAARQKSLKWLQDHVVEGKIQTIDELLKEVL